MRYQLWLGIRIVQVNKDSADVLVYYIILTPNYKGEEYKGDVMPTQCTGLSLKRASCAVIDTSIFQTPIRTNAFLPHHSSSS